MSISWASVHITVIVIEEEINVTLIGELEGTTKCMTNEDVLS